MSVRRQIAKVVARYTIWWYVVTLVLYATAIPATILVFPATTLMLTVVVLFTGFTSTVAALASVIVVDEESPSVPPADHPPG